MTFATCRLACLILTATLLPGSARAQFLTVKAGETVRLRSFLVVDKDCNSRGLVMISMIRDPQLGKLNILEDDEYPRVPLGSLRPACPHTVPATLVMYQAAKGQKGMDQLAFDALMPLGRVVRYRATVLVE